ncbi:delta-60 repeat domain-containing protein [Actinoplanes sp. GCM10030250]|uniref:delta-60 repeat domain-containing protein n=1 Tax=Actinoplanes sp. GCM10030250 TaxID=3273376 RepID=UPI00361033CA
MRTRLLTAGAMAGAVLIGLPAAAYAAPGGFGTDGKITTDFADSADQINALVTQTGGFVAAGAAGRSTDNGGTVTDFGLARYDSRGRLVAGFGTGGKVTTDFFDGTDRVNALVALPGGKLVAGGEAFQPSGDDPEFALARYNANGTLDAGFGTGGKVTTGFGGHDVAEDLVRQPDGKLLAVGYTIAVDTYVTSVAVARFLADGTLDESFGDGGKVVTEFGGGAEAMSAVLQADGKLVVAGDSSGVGYDFWLARYNTDGTLDTSFGDGGQVTTDFGDTTDRALDLAIQADGKLVAVGEVITEETTDFALARYNTNGTLDTGFGAGGRVVTDINGGADQARAVTVRGNRLIVGGSATGSGSYDFAVAVYRLNGSLDTSLGDGGKAVTDFAGNVDEINDVVVQSDGTLLAGGVAYGPSLEMTDTDFAVARYRR